MNMKRIQQLIITGAAGAAALGCSPECPGDTPGIACTYIGTGTLGLGDDGLPPRETELYWAFDVEYDADGIPYFLDWNNHLVRRIVDGRVETVVGGGGVGVGDGVPAGTMPTDLMDPGVPGTDIALNHPTDLQFDGEGHLLLMAWHNHKIRYWDPETELVHVIAGSAPGFRGDGGPMARALFNQPRGLVRRPSDGTLFVLDQRNFMIRAIAPDGTISTVAGSVNPDTGMPRTGFGGDGGPATEAILAFEAGPNPEPSGGITLSPDESAIYITDGLNYRIRRIDLGTGIITTVVGAGTNGFSGDGGAGLSAQISHCRDLEFGPDGRLYFADTENHRIRAWDPVTDIIETVAGNGEHVLGAEGVPATEISLNRPMGVAFAPDGALIIGDTLNSRFLRVAP
jgi:DNA-binding beta-propeller fold protein YncE